MKITVRLNSPHKNEAYAYIKFDKAEWASDEEKLIITEHKTHKKHYFPVFNLMSWSTED